MDEEQLDQAESFWERKGATQRQMGKQDVWEAIDAFLSQRRICALATSGNGFVRCTPLEYGFHGGALWAFTEGGKKFRALRASKAVSVAVFDANGDFGSLRSVQMQGDAELVEPFSEEYVAAAQARGIPLDALRRLSEPMWLIKVVPSEATLLDSSLREKGFGTRQTWRR